MLRSNDLLARMALELGGNTGAMISRYVGIPVSPSTVLRIVKKLDIQSKFLTSGIIGVDDWALKKGRTYGTVIVDLVQKEVIDLLPDREANTLSEWLKKHLEVTTVSRDRYGSYALGVKAGAPQARQVADRFHLLMNLGDATKKVFQSKGKELREVFNLYNNPLIENPQSDSIQQLNQNSIKSRETILSSADLSVNRQHKFGKAKELHAKGFSIRQIARAVNGSRVTIRKYLNMEQLSKRESRNSTNLDAFITLLTKEDNSSKTYRELYQTIATMGFNGKYSQFCHKMNHLCTIQTSLRKRALYRSNQNVVSHQIVTHALHGAESASADR